MALVMFSCRATGPFIMFEETAKEVFSVIGEQWKSEGAIPAEDLPAVLAKLDEAEKRDKKRAAEREKQLRESELLMNAYEDEEREWKKKEEQRVNFYQRIVPLQNMIRRAIKRDEAIVWGRP